MLGVKNMYNSMLQELKRSFFLKKQIGFLLFCECNLIRLKIYFKENYVLKHI